GSFLMNHDGNSPNNCSATSPLSLSEYDLVSPYEVDRNGDYVSHDISHPQRRKRALAQLGVGSLHLRLQGFRQDFHMDLETSSKLVAPGFLIQTLGKRGTKSVQPLLPEDFCFYQGSLRSHKNSSVALSTCGGLSGMIRTQEADYFLKPLPSHLAGRLRASAEGTPPSHILYKRSTEPQGPEPPQMARSQKKWDLENRHLQHQHPPLRGGVSPRHLQKQHFCGRRKKYMPKPPREDLFVLPDEYTSRSRHRRSLLKSHRNQELTVETLVVVDRKMMQNHGPENITTYVLTVLNMVSALFKDGTIGGNINVAVVGLILLEEEQPGLVISHHADHTLSSFCRWQSGLMGQDGTRHDHAILLTGLDICSWKNEPCDTLGFAPISGMCSKYRSCTVNEDTGLGLAFTIAHESGHNFGMVHDGEGNVCKKSEGNIMSPTLAGRNGVFSWSACSRQYLHKFLSTAQAICLADQPKPVKEYKYPEKLPGELYDANTQCKWQFGEKAKVCMLDFKKDICKALWCHRIGRKCETKFMPAAEGTVCGHDMWCRGGQCVKYGDEGPKPTHGHWSDWSPWSPCSRTCGGGVSHRDRLCTNPSPSHGGKFCVGSTRTLKLCNSQKCPRDSVDFRAVQCAEYNSKRFRGWRYKWKPYTHVEDQDLCKLYCIAEGFDFFFSLSNKVKDGTPCSEDSRNVCIDGICERVGCDNVLGSDAVEDSCGVCRGNNSSCTMHKGLYAKQHRTNQYYQVVSIPAGARSIRIYEVNVSTSYISVRNTLKKYYLNGHWMVDWPGRYKFSGSSFNYRRSYKEPETLTSPGPTNETLIVELLFQGRNPGIAWEYSVPRLGSEKKLRAQPSYTWATIRSECSVSCGGGRSLPTALLVMGTGRGALSGHGAHSPGLHHISLVLITLDQSLSHYPHPHPSALAPITLPWSPPLLPGPHHSSLVPTTPPWSPSLCPGPHPSPLAPIALPWPSSLCPGPHPSALAPITLPWSPPLLPGPHHSSLVPTPPPWSPSLCPGPHPSALVPIPLPWSPSLCPGPHRSALVPIPLPWPPSLRPGPHRSSLVPTTPPWPPSLCPGPHRSALVPIALPKFSSGPSGKPRASTRRGRSLSRGSAESSAAEGPLKA
uniref:Peptidase M12B domain-containing protein n=1 Tax=Sus scrofa TaxID=9823 RepID=A0A8D0NAD4_PIG